MPTSIIFLFLLDVASTGATRWRVANRKPSTSFSSLFTSVLSVHRCSRRDRCLRAEETFRYTTDIDRCVRVIAHPDSIAVSAHSVPVGLHIIATVTALSLQSQWAVFMRHRRSARVVSCNISRIERISPVREAEVGRGRCGVYVAPFLAS